MQTQNRWMWRLAPVLALVVVAAGVILAYIGGASGANDGRLNTGGAATAVVYCQGGFDVWTVNNGEGTQAFSVSYQAAADGLATAASQGAHQAIGSSGDVTLYALLHADNPQLQLVRGAYNFIFAADACGPLPAPSFAAAPASDAPAEDGSAAAPAGDSGADDTGAAPSDDLEEWQLKTSNRCEAGNAWGDGRCNHPDPEVQQFLWEQGWYYQRVEDGDIGENQIPVDYRIGGPGAGSLPGAPLPPGAPPPAPGGGATCFTSPPLDISPYLPDVSAMSDRDAMLAMVNAARTYCGRGTLSYDSRLNDAAQAHSQDMVNRSYFSHYASDGPGTPPYGDAPWDRTAYFGYPGGFIGENIASGYGTPRSAFMGWWWSDGHRNNILRSNYTQMGLGEVSSRWTQVFGRP